MSAFDILPGCSLVIPPQRRIALKAWAKALTVTNAFSSGLLRKLETQAYLRLGIPQVIFRIDEKSGLGSAVSPELERFGDIDFGTASTKNIRTSRKMTDDELNEAVAGLLTIWLPDHQIKLDKLKPLCRLILDFDRETFGTDPAKLSIEYDQRVVSVDNAKAPILHRDAQGSFFWREDPPGNTIARVYILRTVLPPWVIVDSSRQSQSPGRELLIEIAKKQKQILDPAADLVAYGRNQPPNAYPTLGPEMYRMWIKQLATMRLAVQWQAYDVGLITTRTLHCSDLPEVPTPSSYMRMVITPISP